MTRPRLGSLCSGYGGLDLAVINVLDAELAWYAELDDSPATVMNAHFPGTSNLGDITAVDWSRGLADLESLFPVEVAPVDIITAGYPCQPFSTAGLRKGDTDERHLWPYVIESIRHLRPQFVVLENVAGHLTLGFDQVLADLAEVGLDAVWTVVHASEAGAPHRRTRLFVLAYAPGSQIATDPGTQDGPQRNQLPTDQQQASPRHDPARPDLLGPSFASHTAALEHWVDVIGRPWPTPYFLSTIGEVALNPGFVEWMMGLPAGYVTGHGIADTACMQMLGNGVIPQQAELALRLLLAMREEALPF